MTNDHRDPLRAAFDDYQPARKELPPPAAHDDGGLADMAGETVTVTHYRTTSRGVTRFESRATITAPIYPKGSTE
ncbi:hypothetical protein AU190_22260 [Mycolicibacterium acapulense]|nr:hypothetical protein AU190_22260 [Mycolicibacterium acapulense]